jgi:hypothetical protein
VAQIDASNFDAVAGTPVSVSTITADPATAITVEVHSTPQIILNQVTGATGSFKGIATLPNTLEPGTHVVIIRAIYQGLPVTLVGGFVMTATGTFEKIVQPTQVTNYSGVNDPRLLRALRFGLPIYDVASHSRTTIGLLVAGGSLLVLAGAGGVVTQAMGAYDPRQSSQGHSKVASAVTKKLKAVGTKHDSWGDRSSTWRHPLTEKVDQFFRDLPAKVGPFSALVPRVVTDGSWLRAIFGAWSTLLLLAGAALGVLSLFFHSAAPFVPSVILIYLLIGLGILDAVASVVGWSVIAVASIVGGSIQSWSDLRTMLGLGVLVVTVPFIAHAIRPLRRYLMSDTSERWERIFDYVMMPIFVAFATASMAKALNGLSGLTILSDANLSAIRWIVAVGIIIRLLGEDAALHFYPVRSKAVQPAKLVSPRMHFSVGSLVFKFLLYLVVMDPYFGLTYRTVTAAALLAIPGVLKLREDSLPNSPLLHRWLPRGLTSFLFMMLIGSFLSFRILGLDPTTATVDSTFLWLLLPGVIIGVIDLFAREGGDWTNVWLKRGLGAFVWLTAAGLVTGNLILFR